MAQGRRLPRIPAHGLALFAAAACCAFIAVGFIGVDRYGRNYWLYRGFPPPRDPAFVSSKGTVQHIKVASAALGARSQDVYVYLPPGYAQQPLILVMPCGSTGTFTDKEWADGTGAAEGWGTLVSRDVVHAVDMRYRTVRSRLARGIGGISEGGYGAINLALQHPREFSLVESWSGYERAPRNHSIFGRTLAGLNRNTPLDALHGDAGALRRLHTYFWFYTGNDDPLRRQNEDFAAELQRLRVSHRYLELAGGHNWALWRGMGRSYLAASLRLHRG